MDAPGLPPCSTFVWLLEVAMKVFKFAFEVFFSLCSPS
jgi:hypothetical protein